MSLADHCEALREHYPPDNRFGLLLDELVKDLREGAPRQEIIDDCHAAQAELSDPQSTLHKTLDRIINGETE
jgi:hypothetical protein